MEWRSLRSRSTVVAVPPPPPRILLLPIKHPSHDAARQDIRPGGHGEVHPADGVAIKAVRHLVDEARNDQAHLVAG